MRVVGEVPLTRHNIPIAVVECGVDLYDWLQTLRALSMSLGRSADNTALPANFAVGSVVLSSFDLGCRHMPWKLDVHPVIGHRSCVRSSMAFVDGDDHAASSDSPRVEYSHHFSSMTCHGRATHLLVGVHRDSDEF